MRILFSDLLGKMIPSRDRFQGIQEVREDIFTGILWIAVSLGFIAVVAASMEVAEQGRRQVIVVYLAAYLPMVTCFLLRHRLDYWVRVRVFLACFYLLGAFTLWDAGLSGAGILLLVTCCVLSTVLLGIKAGLMAVLMGFCAMVVVGVAVVRGVIVFDLERLTDFIRPVAWIVAGCVFAVIGSIMVLSLGILNSWLQHALEESRDKSRALERANAGLKKEARERERLEKRLIIAKKMEAVGTLAGGVAHDLNNILSGLVSYPDLLLMDLDEDDPLREPVTIIKRSGERAATIVQDLLTLSRRGVSVSEPVNLKQVALEYLRSPEYEALLAFHPGVEVTHDWDDGPAVILGSSIHISKAIMNLVSNAAEAIEKDGQVCLTIKNVHLEQGLHGYEDVPRGDYALITVSDTGIGMEARETGRIFEPFFTKKKLGRSGTGLGMAVVWGTIKDHGGYIHVETAPGRGSTFSLYFPLTLDIEPESLPREDWHSYMGDRETVLVVDDLPEQREIAGTILKRLGYEAVSVSGGEEAVAHCRTQKPDLVILDMIMDPGMDGLETFRRLLEIHPDIRVVIASGFSKNDRVQESLNLGALAYIRKPYSLMDLAKTVRRALNQKINH